MTKLELCPCSWLFGALSDALYLNVRQTLSSKEKIYEAILAGAMGLGVLPQSAAARPELANTLSLSASTGVGYSVGNYDRVPTADIVVVPLVLRAKSGRLAITAATSYVKVYSSATAILGPDKKRLLEPQSSGSDRRGFGDLSLRGSYTFAGKLPAGAQFVLSGAVKLPTARKSTYLSTGKIDYAIDGEVLIPMRNLSTFVRLKLDSGTRRDLVRNRGGISILTGIVVVFQGLAFITSLEYSQTTSSPKEVSHSVFAGVSLPIGKKLSVTGYGSAGFGGRSLSKGLGLLVTAKIL